MTSNDFFLIERAAQVQRLRAAKSGNRIDIPARLSRVGCSSQAKQLFGTIDQICKFPLQNKHNKWQEWLAKHGGNLFRARRIATQSEDDLDLLTAVHREQLIAFERQIVELIWDEAADASEAAEAIVSAILRDYRSFSGLKPLEFHSDNVAYEFLFPSWLNLYTALILRRPDSEDSRFSPKQVKTIFRFLQEFERDGDASDLELLGAKTIIAHRRPPLEAQQWLQHLVNLGSLEAQGSSIAFVGKIGRLRDQKTPFPNSSIC